MNDLPYGFIDPALRQAQTAVAEILLRSGTLPDGAAENCAASCVSAITRSGLMIKHGKQEAWSGLLIENGGNGETQNATSNRSKD